MVSRRATGFSKFRELKKIGWGEEREKIELVMGLRP
jgi:hypothetical protein